MPQICISGWNPGLRKVSHTKLLQVHAGMSLTEAKAATDRILDGQHVIFVTSQASANSVIKQFVEIGANAAIINE